jgi:uncharacterized membrane protein
MTAVLPKNVGGRDRQVRFVAGALLVVLGAAAAAAGLGLGPTAGVMLAAGGAALLFNAATQRCLLNRLLGIDTCGESC